ncbi:MAG: hypothetical protein V1674_00870 [Candidatus Omnitrophota bacterium]
MLRQRLFNERGVGVVLIISLIVIVTLLGILATFSSKIIVEKGLNSRQLERTKALYIAEAGLNYAVDQLRANYGWMPSSGPMPFEDGEFELSVAISLIGDLRLIESIGYIPTKNSFRAKRVLEAWAKESIPLNFFNHAIYSAGIVDLNGNAYSVGGDVMSATTVNNTTNITGAVTVDPSISPLARFDFNNLYTKSLAQGNVYDSLRLSNVINGGDFFPPSFWYAVPTNPSDPTTGVPNFVYILDDLVLKGNVGAIGGFFIVVGDVVTNPSGTYDATINGNGQIDGCIYTLGEFSVNGGGGGLNVNGGVWSGVEVELNGNATVNYNADYMAAIQANVFPEVQIISWREKK